MYSYHSELAYLNLLNDVTVKTLYLTTNLELNICHRKVLI